VSLRVRRGGAAVVSVSVQGAFIVGGIVSLAVGFKA